MSLPPITLPPPGPLVRSTPIAFFKCGATQNPGLRPFVELGSSTCDFKYRDSMCYITVYSASAAELAKMTDECKPWDGVF
jgi:hypothetical protein